jgi:hypothetical protein
VCLKSDTLVTDILAAPFLITAMIDKVNRCVTAVALWCPFVYVFLESGVTKLCCNLVLDNIDVREVYNKVFTREIDGISVFKCLRHFI